MMIMTMRMRLTKSLMKLGEQNRNRDNYNNKGSGLQDELCETVVKVESDVKEDLDDDHSYQNDMDEVFEEPGG